VGTAAKARRRLRPVTQCLVKRGMGGQRKERDHTLSGKSRKTEESTMLEGQHHAEHGQRRPATREKGRLRRTSVRDEKRGLRTPGQSTRRPCYKKFWWKEEEEIGRPPYEEVLSHSRIEGGKEQKKDPERGIIFATTKKSPRSREEPRHPLRDHLQREIAYQKDVKKCYRSPMPGKRFPESRKNVRGC